MSNTMLENITLVCEESGFPTPNAVAGSSDRILIQMLALMNRTAQRLLKGFDWQVLQTEHRFYTNVVTDTGNTTSGSAVVDNIGDTSSLTTGFMVSGTGIPNDTFIESVDSGTQVTLSAQATAAGTGVALTFTQARYSLPSDFERLTGGTEWDKSSAWQLLGPNTPQEWQYQKSGYISSGPRVRFRLMGNTFDVFPAPADGLRYGFEYISKNWAQSSASAGKASFTADDDTSLLPDELLVLGTKYEFFKAKGFQVADVLADYKEAVMNAHANDKGATDVNMAPTHHNFLLDYTNIPDTGYGS